jgi:hypothetical protein
MFRTTIFFNDSDQSVKNFNFYKDSFTEIKKKEITYYGFDYVVERVKRCNSLIPSFYFDSIVSPITYLSYPLSFVDFEEKLKKIKLINFSTSIFFDFIIYFFFQFFCTSYNMSPYVLKNNYFSVRTFTGFNFVSIWFNLHFFFPFIFGFFSKDEIKGTFYDMSFSSINTFKQRFCNLFYRKFFFINKFNKFLIIYFFILFLPFFFIFSFFFIFFVSPFIFSFFFIFWRDQLILKNYFINRSNVSSYITFEFWNPVNYYWFNVYFRYISTYVFFCEKPTFFKNQFSALYPHIVNRIYFFSFRVYVKNFFHFFSVSFSYLLNVFGFFHFSHISGILKNEKYIKILESSNSNFFDRKFIFDSYINSIEFFKFKNIFFDFNTKVVNSRNKYSTSIFSWPFIKISNIDDRSKYFYYNYHFSKYNIDFNSDKFRFPYIDPDFVHFYSRELSSDKIFISCITKHDITRLYSFKVFKTAKINKFDKQKIWNVFYNERSTKDKTFYVPTSYYNNFLESNNYKISYFYNAFGLIFIPEFSLFSFFYKLPGTFYTFFLFFFYFLDSFFRFSAFFLFFTYIKNYFFKIIFLFFCDIYFYFLNVTKWSFIPFFDYLKNFYINFYTFYTYTTFIRDFYFERSVNKTFFIESLEETDDEETHFTDTIEQSYYLYWYQDFEADIDCLDFFHDEVYDQFTDVFDYDDDEIDYLNTLYLNDEDVDVSHYDFEVDGLENYRDSFNYFEDEKDQEDFEDTYEDIEHFFSPLEESSSTESDYLFFSIFFLRNFIYDVSDIERTGPRDFFLTGYGPYSSFEHNDAAYDLQSALWRQYFYYYWGSNVPINEDYQTNINVQLQRYTTYLSKWHLNQMTSGKYIKIPNVIRSFGKTESLKTQFSKKSFEKLTVELNNVIFPRSKIQKIFFSDQVEIIWNKISKIFSEKPEYVINTLEKPEALKIFDLISKNSFEMETKKVTNKFFYYSEKFVSNFFNNYFFKKIIIKDEKDFIRGFFGQFHDSSTLKTFNISPSVIKDILHIINKINYVRSGDEQAYNFIKTKNNFIKISFNKIIFSLFIIKFIRSIELDKFREENLKGYLYVINIFSSIQFGNFHSYHVYLKYIIKNYLDYHSKTGEFSFLFNKEQLFKEVLDYGAQNYLLNSFNILSDLGLFWRDLVPNIQKVYENWNDPLLSSFFFPEQFYVMLDYSFISTFDDEQVDIYEETIDYLTEINGGDLFEDQYEIEAGPILEDTSADPDEETFFRSEGLISTVLYEDFSDEDDEYFYPDIYWYEQIEDEPEYDEWEIDFFDEIEDINIPIERIFFGEFYKNFTKNKFDTFKSSVVSPKKTFFYSSFEKKSDVNNLGNAKIISGQNMLTVPKIDKTSNIFFEKKKNDLISTFNVSNSNSFYFFYFFIIRFFKFFLYIYYSIYSYIWNYSVNISCKIRKPLSSSEKEFIINHYKKFKHIYNKKFFVEFKFSIFNWIKSYESFNSKSRLNHTTFEMIRSNMKLDYDINSPLYTSPYSFSWFKEPTITNNFKWEMDEFFKDYLNLDPENVRVDSNFTNIIEDFIIDFTRSEQIKKINEEDAQLYEESYMFGLFLLSTFFLTYEDTELYTEKFMYNTLISIYFLANKKNALHSDLYTQDIYKIFEDDWVSIQNEVGFHKEDPSAWLNILENAPEDDYIENPISPFYVSEEEIFHSSKDYTNKFFIIFDSIWEFLVLVIDYNIYWIRLFYNTYALSYFIAISAYSDKKWLELSINYGFGVYIIRSLFSFSFLFVASLYVVFVIPRIVFIITNSYFSLFFSIFTSGIIAFFIIFVLVLFLFSSVYEGYKDINEYERSTFFFGAFISWFTVVWYSIIENDLYNNEESSNNMFPSMDPDPILAPDSAILEISTPEVIDFDPAWFYHEGASFKPYLAPQPVTFGYFIDVFFSQYVSVANRSLTGYKFRDKLHDDIISESISNYVTYLRQKENVKDSDGVSYGRYASERGINEQNKNRNRINILRTSSKKHSWITKYSDLRYVSQRSSKLYNKEADGIISLDFEWDGSDPLYGQKHYDPEEVEDFLYRGRNVYSKASDNSRFFIRNYYDNFDGDREITIWNVHYRPYDWYSSSYLSDGFFKDIKKYKPFNYSFSPFNYYKIKSTFKNVYNNKINYMDYKLPFDLYFAQKFVYGASEYHFKPVSIKSAFVDNDIKTFKRFNPNVATFNYYVSTLVNRSTKFNYLRDKAYEAHFKYFYFNRFRYYVSKFNPNSKFFSRTSFNNMGGWPVLNTKNSIDIYYHDYPLFMENMKFKLIGYSNKLKMAKNQYYLNLNRPPIISIYNIDFFNWFFVRFFNTFSFSNENTLSYYKNFDFIFQKIFAYVFSKDEEDLKNKLFSIEKNIFQAVQSYKYSFYWNLFWVKTTSKVFDENIVALPSSALLINPNYLPASYTNSLAIRRFYLDSNNYNSRLFSRKQFKRFWYRSTFIPLIDENPIRFSEQFHNFKAYESGIPISPTFFKMSKDPLSKIMKRGIRKPVIRTAYNSYLLNKYYKKIFDFINKDKSFANKFITNVEFGFDSYNSNYPFFNINFNSIFIDKNKNSIVKSVLSDIRKKNMIIRYFYKQNLFTSNKLKIFKHEDFFKGKKSSFYLNEMYRYPFSRSISRFYYDAINDDNYTRCRVRPGSSFFINFTGLNYIPYNNSIKTLSVPTYSKTVVVNEDIKTGISTYIKKRFTNSGSSTSLDITGKFLPDPIEEHELFQTSSFKWSGRHTSGFNTFYLKLFRYPSYFNSSYYGNFRLTSDIFNKFPFIKNKISSSSKNTISNFFSKIAEDESDSILYYNTDFDWPGSTKLKDSIPLSYPYNTNTDTFYDSSGSIFHGKGLYTYVEDLDISLFFPIEEGEEMAEEFVTLHTKRHLAGTDINAITQRHTQFVFDLPSDQYNLINNVNLGLKQPIDLFTSLDPDDITTWWRSFSGISGGKVKYVNKVAPNLIDSSEIEQKLEEEFGNGSDPEELPNSLSAEKIVESYTNTTKVKRNADVSDILYGYISGFDRTPIYSKIYSQGFQKKESFFSFISNNYYSSVERKKNSGLPFHSELPSFKNNTNFFNNKHISPLEKYVYKSYNFYVKVNTHINFPFSRRGKFLNNIITNRRNLYRTRILARLNKYVYASAFEKTYNRVFSGSRIPIIDINPFNVLIDKKDELNTFNVWSNSSNNELLIFSKGENAEDFEDTVVSTSKNVNTETFENVEKTKSKFINTYKLNNNIFEKNNFVISHNNLGDILFQRLKRSRINNFRYMSDKDVAFVFANTDILNDRASKFMSSEAPLFTRQTSNSIDYYRYITNKELEISKKYGNEIKKIRKELNKVRPGHIYKDYISNDLLVFNL